MVQGNFPLLLLVISPNGATVAHKPNSYGSLFLPDSREPQKLVKVIKSSAKKG